LKDKVLNVVEAVVRLAIGVRCRSEAEDFFIRRSPVLAEAFAVKEPDTPKIEPEPETPETPNFEEEEEEEEEEAARMVHLQNTDGFAVLHHEDNTDGKSRLIWTFPLT